MEETTGRIAIGETDRAHLTMAARWARFLAIVQFIALGLTIVAMIFMFLGMIVAGASFSEMAGMSGMPGVPAGFMIGYFAFIFLALIVSVFLTIYLYAFATKTIRAVREGNDAEMTEAFSDLGKFFRFWGIITIVSIVLVLSMVVGVIAYSVSMAGAI